MTLSRGNGAYDDGTALAPGVGTTPLDVRKANTALWASTGVVSGGPAVLVTGEAAFTYSVAGPVQFVTSRGPSDGHQFFANDGATSVTIKNEAGVVQTGAPGSGLSRIDRIWVRHPTNAENTDQSSAPFFGATSGAASSSSFAVPTIPTGALELARNTMTSAATSTLTVPGNTIAQTATVAELRVPVRDSGIRSGPKSGTTSAGGDILVTYATPFPTATTAVAITDTNFAIGGMIFWKVVSMTPAGFTVRAFPASGSAVYTALATSFLYIATGS